MFNIGKKSQSQARDKDNDNIELIIKQLREIYQKTEKYNEFGTQLKLTGDSELVTEINRLLDLKTSQIKTLFMRMNDILGFVTNMTYVKKMTDVLADHKTNISDVAVNTERMSNSIEDVSVYVEKSMLTANDSINVFDQTLQKINQAVEIMHNSFETVKQLDLKMQQVTKDTQKIESFVNIINGITEQTKLLSFNASIEAAKAGEAGMGFSVVAKEMTKLADNTRESASYIRDHISALRMDIGSFNKVISVSVDEFAQAAEHINEAVKSLYHTRESLRKIGESFELISADIEEQTASSEVIADKARQLNTQSEDLYKVCMKAGRDIYAISRMGEDIRNQSVQWYKDIRGSDNPKLQALEHSLMKWKVFNAASGFVQLKDLDIKNYNECFIGRLFETDQFKLSNKEAYESHKLLHSLAKQIISELQSNGNTADTDALLEQLDRATEDFAVQVQQLAR